MKVSTEIDNNFGYEKITQLVDNIPLNRTVIYITRWVERLRNTVVVTSSFEYDDL